MIALYSVCRLTLEGCLAFCINVYVTVWDISISSSPNIYG